MAINLKISKLKFPANQPLGSPITVDLYYKGYYDIDFVLVGTGYNVDVDGTITDSPSPVISVDAGEMYVVRAVNGQCGQVYDQVLSVNAYCPVDYTMAEDGSYCYIEEVSEAIPPTEVTPLVAATAIEYSTCGTAILDEGFDVDGTGSYELIDTANTYWRNGEPFCSTGNTSDGPMNRSGVWGQGSPSDPASIGFSVCINVPEGKTYYVGIGCDNYAVIKLDGETIVEQDEAALDSFFGVGGAPFKLWYIYPVHISAGKHILELYGVNDGGAKGLGCQVYNNTVDEIKAATSDGDLNFIFNSGDYIGQTVQLGTGGTGWTCADPDAQPDFCESPVVCRKIVKIPVSIGGIN